MLIKEVLKTIYSKSNTTEIDKDIQNEFYDRDKKQFPYSLSNENDFSLEDKKKIIKTGITSFLFI